MNLLLFFSALADHDYRIKLIERHVRNLGKRTKSVQGDGHCMLHAFRLGLREKDKQGDYTVESLKTKIENELSNNKQFYSDYSGYSDYSDRVIEKDLDAYLNGKKYNSDVVDLIPHVIANATNTSISILYVQNNEVKAHQISPLNKSPKRSISVYKIGEHYGAILDEETDSVSKVEGKPNTVVNYFPLI